MSVDAEEFGVGFDAVRLPPGQKVRPSFPRFGLPPYANRFPSNVDSRSFGYSIDAGEVQNFDFAETQIQRTVRRSDFHCVTTWSFCGSAWGGISFAEFYRRQVEPLIPENQELAGAVLTAQDGYRTSLLIEDLLHDDVLLADELNDQPLTVDHGAPLRLIAPAHYGYKNLKHLARVDFYSEMPTIKRGIRAFLDHPRARVSREERGRWLPGWLLRYLYRPLITGTAREFSDATRRHAAETNKR